MGQAINKNEVLNYLKDKSVLTTGNNDNFVMVGEKIVYRFNGSSVMLSLGDFNKLFKDSSFYILEDTSLKIDELKDREYYERYRK